MGVWTSYAVFVDLDQELDRLYQLPLADFIGVRNDLAKRLRAEGNREEAEKVKKLAKPSLTAWVANQLHFQAPRRLAALYETGDRIKTAIAEGAGAHQAAMKARRETVAELLAIADEILDGAGQTLSRVHRQRLTRTLETLAGGQSEAVPGRLSQDLEPPGFDALSGLAASLGQMPRRSAKPEPAVEHERQEPNNLAEVVDLAAERQSREDKARERKLTKARDAVAAAEKKLTESKRRADEARSAVVDAEGVAAEARAAAETAEQHLRQARSDAEATAASAKRAGDDLAAAEEQLQRLQES